MLAFIVGCLIASVPDPPPSPPPLPCRPLGPTEQVRIDLADVPLADFARAVSCALEKNILFDPPTLGAVRVTVLGPRPIARRDLERLWLAVLAQHGLVSEHHGAFEQIRKSR